MSKGELRAEIARLRKNSVDTDALIRTIASIQDPHICKMALQDLVESSLSRDDILREYRDRTSDSSISGTSSHTSQAQSPVWQFSQQSTLLSAAFQPEEPPSCFDQLLTWHSCRPNPVTVSAVTPPPLSLPPLSLDAYTAHSGKVDTWTRTGWTHAHVHQLIEALRTWDYLPLCIFSEELFLRDYDDGTSRFCSITLVHAILALATCLINHARVAGGAWRTDTNAGKTPNVRGWAKAT